MAAIGTYDLGLSTGQNTDGLYVGYQLTQLDLQTTLTLENDAATPAGANDMKAKITGSGNLEIDATGTIILKSSNNTYSGKTTVTSGTLQLGDNNVLGQTTAGQHTSELNISAGAKVDVNGKTQTIGSFIGADAGGGQGKSVLDLNNGTLNIETGGTSNGMLTGLGTLNLNGGALTVNGANTGLQANVNIDADAAATINDIAGLGNTGTVTIASVAGTDGALNINLASATPANLSKQIAGAGDVNLQGLANVNLTGDNSGFSGEWNIALNTALTADIAADLGTAVINNAGTFTVDTGTNWTLANAMTGAGNFIKDGTGNLTIAQANVMTGPTTISGGILTLTNEAGVGSGSIAVNTTANQTTTGLNLAFTTASVFDNQLSGAGTTTVAAGSQKATITGNNAGYTGRWEIAGSAAIDSANAAIVNSSANLGTGLVNITGTLDVSNTGGDFTFNNALGAGATTGRLIADNNGNAFNFGPTATVDTIFKGVVALSNNTFDLSAQNTSALTSATLEVGAGNVTTVGLGAQNIGGLTFDGGTVIFDAKVPADQVSPSNIVLSNTNGTGVLNIGAGGGVVRVDTSGFDTNQTVPSITPLLLQDEGAALTQLVDANGVTGNVTDLTLEDINNPGTSLGAGVTVGIDQNGTADVAEATYNYTLADNGAAGAGLYVSYALTQVELLKGGTDALILSPVAGTGGSDFKAIITGTGDLAIQAGTGGTVTLMNDDNDYEGVTFVRSGTLALGDDNTLGQTKLLQIEANAIADINGKTQTIGAFDGKGNSTLNLNGGDLTVAIVNGSAGIFTGEAGSFQNIGTGTLTLEEGGTSAGTLTGAATGTFNLNDDFVVTNGGNNGGLASTVNVANGVTATLDHAAGLGNSGTVNLNGAGAQLELDFTGANAVGTLAKTIAGTGTVSLLSDADVTIAAATNNSGFTGTWDIDTGTKLSASTANNLGAAAVTNDGELHINTSTNWQIDNVVTGAGDFYKEGNGTLTAGANLNYNGTTFVNQGTFAASAAGTFSTSSAHIVAAGATLDAAGFNQTVASLTNAGTVNVAGAGAAPAGATFTVNGNYVGNGGTVILGAKLNDDTSAHDTLVITGHASGTTSLKVQPQGGAGAATINGIKLVDVGTSDANAFTLFGNQLTAGAYYYTLKQGGEGNSGADLQDWYLVSLLGSGPGGGDGYRPEVGSYLDNRYTAMRTQWHTLHDRQTQAPGLIGQSGKPDANSWIRIQGSESDRDTRNFKTSDRQYLVHLGSDIVQWDKEQGSLRLGLMGMVSHNKGDSQVQGLKSRHSVDGYSGGIYATWYGNDDPATGPYVDAWLMGGRFDNAVKGDGPREKYHATAWAASLEAGYGFTVHEDPSGGAKIVVQPQAQVIASTYKAGKHTEENGTVVSKLNDNDLTTRLGVRVYADILRSDSRLRPFAEANWWRGQGSHSMAFGADQVKDKLPGNVWEVKLGLEGNATKNLSLWGALGVQGGQGYRNNTLYVGMKYAW
ncbi:MAG: autotransporter outer membrane beta-barrel domain-containing protein [Zoogloeaceae bacterium]|nr:autotransporter outer membrane beta-barrel domain-containing protein [Zoogloeaceae bacterium]